EAIGPATSAVENGENLDPILSDSIRDEERGARHEEFSRAGHAPGPAQMGMTFERFDRAEHAVEHVTRRGRPLTSKIFVDGFEMVAGKRRPSQLHPRRRRDIRTTRFRMSACSINRPA